MNTEIKLVASKEILHANTFNSGPVIGRVEAFKIGDGCDFSEVSYWYEAGKLKNVTCKLLKLMPIWAVVESQKTTLPV